MRVCCIIKAKQTFTLSVVVVWNAFVYRMHTGIHAPKRRIELLLHTLKLCSYLVVLIYSFIHHHHRRSLIGLPTRYTHPRDCSAFVSIHTHPYTCRPISTNKKKTDRRNCTFCQTPIYLCHCHASAATDSSRIA